MQVLCTPEVAAAQEVGGRGSWSYLGADHGHEVVVLCVVVRFIALAVASIG